MSETLNSEWFISALQHAGWRAPLDAQHDQAAALWDRITTNTRKKLDVTALTSLSAKWHKEVADAELAGNNLVEHPYVRAVYRGVANRIRTMTDELGTATRKIQVTNE